MSGRRQTQWHQVVGFGDGFAKLAERLVKGTHVFVQGELTTREYDRTIKVPNGKKVIEHVMKQLVVELKADTIRILDRSSNGERDAAEPQTAERRRRPTRGLRPCLEGVAPRIQPQAQCTSSLPAGVSILAAGSRLNGTPLALRP